ncbi:TetR/AcrR family transcriptional regulator [Kitasatospora sp. NPDC051853]|uniref:TetR/AcrR family transcriptional regulator n=1 Tax=Kitasatospora sp. NPDC051853 TaxID=3364058 RepID=UPI0037A54A31
MAGRPRSVPDEVILRAATEVIGRGGPSGLTLAAVAREVGLAPATLVQRFGSKAGLLAALARHSAAEAAALPERVRAEHDDLLAALTALVADWMAPMDTPERFANHLAMLCADLADPELHAHARTAHEAQLAAVKSLLTEAQLAGELRESADARALAGSVQAVTAGAGLVWAVERYGPLAERLARELSILITPYLTQEQT